MSKKPRTAAEYIWSNLKLKSTDSASIEGDIYLAIVYYVTQCGYGAFEGAVTSALSAYDKSSRGVISFKDFQDISGSGFDPFASEEALSAIFKVFDTKEEGYIYSQDLIAAAASMKMQLSEEDAEKIIQSMDLDQDGAVDFKEFKSVVKN